MRHGLFVLLTAVACTSQVASTDTMRIAPTSGPLVVSCCGDSDSLVMAQMRAYEATAEGQRTADVALFPYRMTSGITRRDRIVIRDRATWERMWPEIVGSHSPRPGPSAVDFSRETIVVATMGQRSSGGYVITIDSAGLAGDTVILAVTERSPGRTCGTTAALSSPVALARVLRPSAVVRFVEKTTVTEC